MWVISEDRCSFEQFVKSNLKKLNKLKTLYKLLRKNQFDQDFDATFRNVCCQQDG